MRATTIRTTALAAGAALVLAGCGSTDELTDGLEELSQTLDEELPDEGDDEDEGDDGDETVEPVVIDEREIDVAVHQSGLEWTVQELTVVDLDEGADEPVQGLELTFATQVLNPGSDTVMPSSSAALRWDDPDTGDTIEVGSQPDFREVPGDSSTTGAFVVTMAPSDLEVFDEASARLIIGQSGQSAAQIPLGTDAELIDRFPVQQDDLVGATFQVDEVEVTITAAETRWDRGNGNQVEDGLTLLELTYDMTASGSQSCSTRGTGAWALTLPSGDGVVDLGVSERCVRGGETETDVRTGFDIEGDVAGEYTLRHERGDDTDEVTFTLDEGDGARADERDTR